MPWGNDGGLRYAQAALGAYGIDESTPLELISLSENATFLVGGETALGVLRVYRPNYQTDTAKRSELAWIDELRATGAVRTPAVISSTRNDQLVRIEIDGDARDCVMFEHIRGRELATSGLSSEDLEVYEQVGKLVATLHLQVLGWQKPDWFERMRWGIDEILGQQAPWGDWRSAPGLDEPGMEIIERAERRLRERLRRYPQTADNSGLVHCDLRTTNVMKDERDELWVIDFDDAGYSWLLWDLCSTTSFIEHDPDLVTIVNRWLVGYTSIRELETQDLAAIPDLVFLRRLHLMAWIGSHPDAGAAKELGVSHTAGTVAIAREYLDAKYLAGVTTD